MGLPHHAQRVFGFPDISISENGNLYRLFQFRNCVPCGVAVIKLRGGSCVKPHGRAAFVFGNLSCRQKSEVLQIDPQPELDRHGDSFRITNCGTNNIFQEIRFQWNRGAPALAGYFGNGASEIHVQMIDAAVVDQAFHSFGNVVRVCSV